MGCVAGKQSAATAVPTPASELDGHIFLAVNGTSGGQASGQLLALGCDSFEMSTKQGGKKLKVTVFNLRDGKLRQQGFEALAAEVQRTARGEARAQVRVVACGGDGTVKWVISELSKVKCLSVPIGVIPFGTGNDFSRAFGWGASPPNPLVGKHMAALKQRLETVFFAEVGPLDTWLVELTLREGGAWKEVKDGKVTETHKGERSITHEMINYFSVGADAQIVFEFEQQRTKSQLGNKLVYVRKGTGMMVSPPKTLKKMGVAKDGVASKGKALKVRPQDRILAFLNIPSYSAGANVWFPGTGRNGTFFRQYVGDKKLECLSVASTTDVAIHIASGNSSTMGVTRVAQNGEYDIAFADKAHVYLQVDGEAILAEDIATATVRHGYQVNVLRSPSAIAKPGRPDSYNSSTNNNKQRKSERKPSPQALALAASQALPTVELVVPNEQLVDSDDEHDAAHDEEHEDKDK